MSTLFSDTTNSCSTETTIAIAIPVISGIFLVIVIACLVYRHRKNVRATRRDMDTDSSNTDDSENTPL